MITNPTTVNNEIIDLDLSVTKKKKFRFDHDDTRIIELNTSDMGIIGRISDAYPKLTALQDKASKMMEGLHDDDAYLEDDLKLIGTRLSEVDNEMRKIIDEIFSADVSAKAAPDGSMYDPFDGTYRFEHIINLLMSQYEKNLQDEYAKIERQVKSHTEKYTKK